MKTTTSVHWNKGQVAHGHNRRCKELCENEKHIDLHNLHGKSFSEELYRKDLKQLYIELFLNDIKEYNLKVKKCRRKTVESYMNEIENDTRGKRQTKRVNKKKVVDENAERRGKQLCYEVTIKIGNTERERDGFGRTIYDSENHHVRNEYLPRELQQEILKEYYETFQENNPNFRLQSVDLHADEGFFNKRGVWEYSVDHLHVCFVPIARNFKQGMRTQNSMNRALREMGCNSYESWSKREQVRLEEITMKKYKEYCEKNTSFAQEHEKLELYHPVADQIRRGGLDKEQHIKEIELQEERAELNILLSELENVKNIVNKISKQKNDKVIEQEKILIEKINKFNALVDQEKTKLKNVFSQLNKQKEVQMKKEKEIQNEYRNIEIEKTKIYNIQQEIRRKLDEIDVLKQQAKKYESEMKKRLKIANTGSERVMSAFIRSQELYDDFIDFCENYFEFETDSKNYDRQYEYHL